MRFLALGPLTVRGHGGETSVGGARQRAILALLLLNLNQVVPIARIVDDVWSEGAPTTVRDQVHAHISRLRRLLDGQPATIRTSQAGYLLRADPTEFDVAVFDRTVHAGRRLLAAGDPAGAQFSLREALNLWRGQPFGDVEARFAVREIARLKELRLTATRSRIEADLQLGHDTELTSELTGMVIEHPLREDLRRLLMLALYRAGGRADALEVFWEGCQVLRDELGLDPGPELVAAHEAILHDDPGLRRIERRVDAGAPRPSLAWRAPVHLPAAVGHFTGRAEQADQLSTLLHMSHHERPIAVIRGPSGVGKTALAVHWARHNLTSFPDGQLFLDFDSQSNQCPWTPADALTQLLRDLGVPAVMIPPGLRAKTNLYRAVMADRACLILIDNAPSSEHVRALVAHGRSIFVITTRGRLDALATYHAVRPVTVEAFTTSEAVELLRRVVGAERIAREPAATLTLVALCGHWPLALRIAAARLATQPGLAVGELADEVASAHGLHALQVEGRGVGPGLAETCRLLSQPASQLLHRLAPVAEPTDLDTAGIATAAGIDEPTARTLLVELVAAGLVDRAGTERFSLRHLPRLWALQQSPGRRRSPPTAVSKPGDCQPRDPADRAVPAPVL